MASESIDPIIISDFKEKTSYDISVFLQQYVDFIDVDYANITNFYSGNSTVSPTDSFKVLNNLTEEQRRIVEIFRGNENILANYGFWILLEYIEDIGSVLETANNLSKWLRSSQTKDGYNQSIEIQFVARQGQGIEDIERNDLKSLNPNEDWVDTAIKNELREEDYTLDGGYLLKVNYKNNTSLSGLVIQSIVDNINTSLKTYGLDLNKKITIVSNDLQTLSYRDTILQEANIYANMSKGDNPFLPDDGVDKRLLLGSNVATISYPVIFKQLASLFAKDDSFKNFSITDIRREMDAVFIDFQVQTRAGEIINSSIRSN